MNSQQFASPISDLGFDPGMESNNNYPDGFVTSKQLEIERRMNLEIIECNGGEGWKKNIGKQLQ